MIEFERNRQLTRFSTLHYKRIYNNAEIYENNSVIIICVDPKSTFNEIFIKTFKTKFFKQIKFPIILVCSEILLKKEFKKFKTKINLNKFTDFNELKKNRIYYIDIPLDLEKLTKKKVNLYIKRSFQIGLNLLKEKKSLALINSNFKIKWYILE